MNSEHSVKLSEIISEFQLETIFLGNPEAEIITADVNRPGLPLSGFTELFQPHRIQIIGREEHAYLQMLDDEVRTENLENFMREEPACVILSSSLEPHEEMLAAAKRHNIPLLRTSVRTSEFMSSLISSLRVKLAPKITRHGVMVEVYGIGILILGDSGIGKSETAIELVKRGHRLIADDAVEIRRVSAKTLVANAPEIIRHYVELRGIGIVDVRRIFGIGAVKDTEKINLVIKMEHWVEGKIYDRIGLENEVIDIMGVELPTLTIPVRGSLYGAAGYQGPYRHHSRPSRKKPGCNYRDSRDESETEG